MERRNIVLLSIQIEDRQGYDTSKRLSIRRIEKDIFAP